MSRRCRDAGITDVTIAWLEPGDVARGEAAARIARALAEADDAGDRGLVPLSPAAPIFMPVPAGLVLIDADAIEHSQWPGRSDHARHPAALSRKSRRAQMLATIKIIPFAAREDSAAAVENLLSSSAGLRVKNFGPGKRR